MKYKCLVLDHDDTVMNSTATLHYPAFLAYMEKAGRSVSISLEDYFLYNFEPGVIPFFRDICGLSPAEMAEEEQFWRDYVRDRIPPAYERMPEILQAYRRSGGLICVVSHSFSDYICRDYAANGLPEPDLIFGWDMEPALRKPSPYSLNSIMEQLNLAPEEMLVLDDLKPGYDMAAAAGVPFAAAGWANDVEPIETFMRSHCDYYFKTVREFEAFLQG